MRRSFTLASAGFVLLAISILPAWADDHVPDKPLAAAADKPAAEAREHVHQALLAETLGDNAERSQRLAKALESAPDLAEAHWHLAQVQVNGQWVRVADVTAGPGPDSYREKYRALRDKADASPKALRDLARWCQKNGQPDIARVHYAQLLASRSADAEMKREAVQELNLSQVGGRWMAAEELETRREQAESIENSLTKWRPILKKLQVVIDGEDYSARDKAVAELHKIEDAAAIPALQSFLLDGGDRFSEEAVKLLSKFKHYEATEALLRYAVLSNYAITRDKAVLELKRRPLHEFVPQLLGALVSPLKSQFLVTWDRYGRINYAHGLLQETPTGNTLLLAHQLSLPSHSLSVERKDSVARTLSRTKTKTPSKVVTSNIDKKVIETGLTPAEALRQERVNKLHDAANLESQVRLANSHAEQANLRLLKVLEATTSETYRTPSEWQSWWQAYNEVTWPKPTQYYWTSNASYYAAHQSRYEETTGTVHTGLFGPRSCFLAGTPVQTESGQAPIESIRPGDRVLAQDQESGELTYKVVLTTTLRPPAKMLAVHAGGDKLVTTLGHPFWVSGHGWRMAKQLKEGDLLHSVNGAARVSMVEPAGDARAHNLVVDDFNTYFVGQIGLLVHDNEFRKPTRAIVPGLITD